MSFISELTLTQFRNHPSLRLQPQDSSVIITGPNGTGKTNILEAISLLSPGRGLRQARINQLACQNTQPASSEWAVFAELHSDEETYRIGTGTHPDSADSRLIKCDGEIIKSQNFLGEVATILWQTPQMDGLFLASQSERRQFYDRLVGSFLPHHRSFLANYDKIRRERIRLLQTPEMIHRSESHSWLNALEKRLAELTFTLAANRLEILQHLNHSMQSLAETFPKAQLSLNGFAENWLLNHTSSAVEGEEMLKNHLQKERESDRQSGRSASGAHKTEWIVVLESKGIEAAYGSTGEQKALLLSLLLAQTHALTYRQHRRPILLLDEVVAHLDSNRRGALFEALADLAPQLWMTGVDKALFTGIEALHISTAE